MVKQNADFLKCSDNNGDIKFSIQEEGNTAIAGTLAVIGQITGDTINLNLLDAVWSCRYGLWFC